VLEYDEMNHLLVEKSFTTIRKELKLQYTFTFKYDKNGNQIEKTIQLQNEKPTSKTVYDYDSQNRKIFARSITSSGKETLIEKIEYNDAQVVTTHFKKDGIVKYTDDSINHITLIEEFDNKNRLIYSRKKRELFDKYDNWNHIQLDFVEKYFLWFKRAGKTIMERKIKYYGE